MDILASLKSVFGKETELKPVFEKQRPRCPFYGFAHLFGNMFMDSEGNQCPLILNSYSPCQMEMREEFPNWNKCSFNNEKSRIETVINFSRIAPKEFWPKGQSSWSGIPFKKWMKYVMS